jgi:hypothetical protein
VRKTPMAMAPAEVSEFHAERADLFDYVAELLAGPPTASQLAVMISSLEIGAERSGARVREARRELLLALHDVAESRASDALEAEFEALFSGADCARAEDVRVLAMRADRLAHAADTAIDDFEDTADLRPFAAEVAERGGRFYARIGRVLELLLEEDDRRLSPADN